MTYVGREPLDADKEAFALGADEMAAFGFVAGETYGLEEVVKHVHPTFLIGTCGTPGTFSEATITEMAAHARLPVILPMSNPTSRTEAQPAGHPGMDPRSSDRRDG